MADLIRVHRNRTAVYPGRVVQRPVRRFKFASVPGAGGVLVSTGARACELFGARGGDVDVGQQLIAVIGKGTGAMQPVPASPDALVWLRLYQARLHGLVPTGVDDPAWWRLRRPLRQLSYHALYRMFTRVNQQLETN
jgi:integrase